MAELPDSLTIKVFRRRMSAFLTALVLFVVANGAILLYCGEMPLSAHLPSSLSILNERYSAQSEAPVVALLGSSLMRSPFHACDEERYGSIDYVNYSEARSLSDRLSSEGSKITIFNVARDGAMVTDSLLIEEKLLRGKLKPQLIVYGIAPRDFVDCLLENERATDAFNYFFDFWDAIKYGDVYSSNWVERFELVMTQAVPLYSARNALRSKGWEVLRCDAAIDGVRVVPPKVDEDERIAKLVSELTSSFQADSRSKVLFVSQQSKNGEIIVKAAGETKNWLASLWQYSLRYIVIDEKRFERELKAFEHILKIAKQREIKVLVLNMPLAPANIGLLPDGFYNRYLTRTKAICQKQSVDYCDLQTDLQFSRSCYRDAAHLNARGGKVLTERISRLILQVLKKREVSGQMTE